MRASVPISRTEMTRIVGNFRNVDLPRITASVARTQLAEVLSAGAVPYQQFVDGREGAALESVKPGGMILFRFNRLGIVLDWIYMQLVGHSPIGKDTPPHLHYFQDHELWINGSRVSASAGEVIEVPAGGEAIITDLRPYASRIEHGLSTQAPDGVYEITAIAAARRFPSAKIEFDYRPAVGPIEGLPSPHGSPRHNRARHGDYKYPTIIVRTGA